MPAQTAFIAKEPIEDPRSCEFGAHRARPHAVVSGDRASRRPLLWLLAALVLIVLAGLPGVVSQARAQAPDAAKIGFVSLDRILRDAAPAQRAQKKIEGEFQKREQELVRMEQQLKRLQDQLEKNTVTMSENDRRNREREFNDVNREFQRKKREFSEDLNQRRNEELASVLERANQAVRRIAEAERFDIIFQDAVWANPRIDITDRVIKALDDTKPAAGK